MTPLGISILLFLIVIVLFASRRTALLAIISGVLYLTQGQHVEIGGLNVFAIRFLELAGFIRVMLRREFNFSILNKTDQALIMLYSFIMVVYCIRADDGWSYVLGQGVDAFLCYFTFRGLINNMDDLHQFLRTFLIILAPYTLIILYESFSGNNVFSSMGWVADGTWGRGNRIRCFGSFRQPDTLGMFGACFLPLFIGLFFIAKDRQRALLGITLCLVLAWAANSGGAAASSAMGIVGWAFWNWRSEMQKIRWMIAFMIIALALVMKAPVWFIFSHISEITGGDGYHRSYLIDVAWRHFGQWWLTGMPIADTYNWFAYHQENTLGADITNQFLAFGLSAGVGAIILLIILLKRAYVALGNALEVVRSTSPNNGVNEYLLWGLGVAMVVHIVDWFGITYFDQSYVIWFMHLAAVSSLSCYFCQDGATEQPAMAMGENAVIAAAPARNC